MTRLQDGVLIIETEAPGTCELCGEHAELRPYGPRGENICIECGQKNHDSTVRQIYRRLVRPIN